MNNAGVVAAIAAAGAVLLSACSPSLEEPSSQPPGSEPDLRIDAPADATPVTEEPEAKPCAIGDFTVDGEAGSRPEITVPDEPCVPAEKPLSKDLAEGDGVVVEAGAAVSISYTMVGVTSGTEVSTWTSETETEPEAVAEVPEDGWRAELAGMNVGGRKLIVLSADELGEAEGFEPGEAVAIAVGVANGGA